MCKLRVTSLPAQLASTKHVMCEFLPIGSGIPGGSSYLISPQKSLQPFIPDANALSSKKFEMDERLS